jgi:membrane-associated phospholipid phosphatase
VTVPRDGNTVVTRMRAARAAAWCAGGCLVVLALLGAGVRADFGPQLRIDAAVSDVVYAGDNRAAALDWLLEALTAPGLSWVRFLVFLPVVVRLVQRRLWWTAAWIVTTVVVIAPLTGALKDYFGRIRPPFENGGAGLESLSFPSGHSSGIATLVTVALVLAWPLLSVRARRWALGGGAALVLLVGLTRMWLGLHFLSDVLGGWALGVAWTLALAVAFGALPGGRAALPARQTAEVA